MPSKRIKAREAKKNIATALIIVAFAAVVFSVNSIGKFIAQKLILPIANTGSAKAQTVSFSLNETQIFAVGEEASKKDAVISLGGAGFEFNENVLFSCYSQKEQADAAAQKHSLLVLPLSADKLSVKLTGTSEQILPIKDGINLLQTTLLDTLNTSALLELSDVTRTQAKANAELNLKNLNDTLNKIADSENSTIKELKLSLQCYITAFSSLENTQSESFLTSYKTLCCTLACEYLSFASAID